MTIEVHSTEKKQKDTGNTFRSFFATAIDGEELAAPMGIVFTKKSGGKPRNPHAILTIEKVVGSTYGNDRYTGKRTIFVSDPYTEKAVEPKKRGKKLCKPSEWTDGDEIPTVAP